MFCYSSSQNPAYLTNFESITLWYLVTQIFTADKYINNLPKYPLTNTKQIFKDGVISWFRNFCEGGCESGLYCLAWMILREYTTVANQC